MCRSRRAGPFAVGLALLFTASPGSAERAAPQASTGQIAFLSGVEPFSYANRIYVESADGGDLRPVTGPHDTLTFAWSPNGSRFVFDIGNGEMAPRYLYTINADGTDRQRVTHGGIDTWDVQPDWSPDGSTIAFSGSLPCDGGGICFYAIFTMDPDGSNPTQLTNGRYSDLDPAWSPDGSKLVFFRSQLGVSDLFTINLDGSGLHQITHTKDWESNPTWSPLGSSIAFIGNEDSVKRVRASTGKTKLLFRCTHTCSRISGGPSWSPNGRKLLISLHRNGSDHLYELRRDGSHLRRIRTQGIDACCPAWFPAA